MNTPKPTRVRADELTSRDAIWTSDGLRQVIHTTTVSDRVIAISVSTGRIYARPDTMFHAERFAPVRMAPAATACPKHPAFELDYCPGCGTARRI